MPIPGPLAIQIAEILVALIATDNTATSLILVHLHQQHLISLLCPPLQVVRDYCPKLHIAYDPENKFTLDVGRCGWCDGGGGSERDLFCTKIIAL